MRSYLFLVTAIIMFVTGCNPYPRYRSGSSTTPREQVPLDKSLTTDEFVDLGLILQSYLGRPYKGKSKFDDGLDCSEFTGEVFRKFNGTRLPRTSANQFKTGKRVPANRLSYGDLVFFRTQRDKVSHVGIYIGHDKFIHASTSRGVIITGMNETYWSKRFAGGRRILK